MAYEETRVEDPIRCPDAFLEQSDQAKLSQSALLLSLSRLVTEPETARSDLLTPEQGERFPLPEIQQYQGRFSGGAVNARATEIFGRPVEILSESGDALPELLYETATRLYEVGDPIDAALLVALALRHPDRLVSTSAGVAHVDMFGDVAGGMRTLMTAAAADQDIAARIAAVALNRVTGYDLATPMVSGAPENLDPMPMPPSEAPADGLVLVHGTTNFAFPGGGIPGSWWRPGEPLYEYLRTRRLDIYSGPTPFEWGGAWNDQGRDFGARHLRKWLEDESLSSPDFVAHSHGANLLFAASGSYGLFANRMVLLSCPVHWGLYRPDFDRVRFLHSIRINMDLIILADFGAQSFPYGAIAETIMPIWFLDHGDTYEPEYWDRFGFDRLYL